MNNFTESIKRLGLAVLFAVIMGVGLVACGGSPTTAPLSPQATTTTAADAGSASSATSTPCSCDTTGTTGATSVPGTAGTASILGVQEVKVTLKEWSIEPANIKVRAGKVRFIVTNAGQTSHNLAISAEGKGELTKTKNFTSAENPQTLEVDLQPGTYTLICDITGHADRGMKGTLVVK